MIVRSYKDVLVLFLFLLTSLVVYAQIIITAKTGEGYCLNQGCRIVESLTRISPVMFNTLGFFYFISLALLITAKIRSFVFDNEVMERRFDLCLKIMLLSGLSSEAVFISYQIFVAHTFCSYCIGIFLSIFISNMLLGKRQFVTGSAIVIAGITASGLLKFEPAIFAAKKDLDHGTYAIKTCTERSRDLYFIFSKDCQHCKKVLEVLKGCSQCEVHFNPINRIDEPILPGLVPEASYDPNINVLTLKILGINEIPVLIDRGERGMLFIKGDKNIIDYIEKHCFTAFPSLEEELHEEFQDENGVCTFELEKECN